MERGKVGREGGRDEGKFLVNSREHAPGREGE